MLFAPQAYTFPIIHYYSKKHLRFTSPPGPWPSKSFCREKQKEKDTLNPRNKTRFSKCLCYKHGKAVYPFLCCRQCAHLLCLISMVFQSGKRTQGFMLLHFSMICNWLARWAPIALRHRLAAGLPMISIVISLYIACHELQGFHTPARPKNYFEEQ